MSFLQDVSSQSSQYEAVQELMSEIAFQKVILSSIDGTVDNREAAEKEVRDEIKALEKQLKDLRRPPTTTALSSRTQLSSQPAHASSSKSTSHKGSSGRKADKSETGNMESHLGPDQWNMASSSSTASTPNSSISIGDLLSPSKMDLPTRKRSHSSHLDGFLEPFADPKSRRTSPSPYHTRPTTPATSSGDEEFEAFDREFFKLQQDAEERIQREKLDAEFARSIQNEPHNFGSINPPSTSTSLSALDRISGIRTSASTSSFGTPYARPSSSSRQLPWSPSNMAPSGVPKIDKEERSMTSGVKREEPSTPHLGFSPTASMNNGSSFRFKAETPKSRPMPGTFQDDSSDADDSDIEIIPPSAFRDNGRRSTSNVSNPQASSTENGLGTPRKSGRLSYSPEAQISGQAALRRLDQGKFKSPLQIAMSGNQQIPALINSLKQGSPFRNGGPLSQSGPLYSIPAYGMPNGNGAAKSVLGMQGPAAGGYVYPSASIGNGINGVSNGLGSMNGRFGSYPAYPGGHMQHAGLGLGYTVNNVPNYAINQPGFAQGLGGASILDPVSEMIRRASTMNDEDGQLTSNYWDDVRIRDQYNHVVNDPRKTNQEIKELLENIRPDVDLPPEDREGTPEGLVYPLYEHQKLALTWLKSMEEGTNKGGILADDMGLGKTISALALMLSRPSNDRSRKATLIVGPVALVRQWEREIRMKVKVGHRMSTHMVHGQAKKLSWDDLRTYDVVLTTYGTLGAEYRRLEKFMEKKKAEGGEIDQAPMRKLFPLLGPRSLFYRVILDEAQCIKNKVTVAARACCNIKSSYRFCLTGTPMMNNVGELYSLVHFLRIKPYNEWSRFQDQFGMLTKGDATKRDVQGAMRKLQALLKAILLRRVKTSLIDGKPIINLPPKTEEIQHVIFSGDEQAFYKSLETKTQLQFNKYMKANTVGKNYSNVLVLLLRLRQACCHPHLIHDFEEPAPAGAELSVDAMMELARSLEPDVIARILSFDGSFECPVCYDGVENPSIVIPCGHDTCSECLSRISDQAAQQNVANGEEAGAASKCPSCRGKIEMNKVIDYSTFKKVHKPDVLREEDIETASENSVSDCDSETASDSEDQDDADSEGDLRGFIVPDGVEDEIADEEDPIEDSGDMVAPNKYKFVDMQEEKKRRKIKKGKKKAKKPKKEHLSIAMLKKEASKSAEGRRKYMRYLRKNWQPSAKIEKCVELIEQFQNDGQKTIVFSQFVSLLDLLQVPVEQKGWACERYDGGMSADARNDAIVRFTDKSNTKLMLISLKAGNAGLNLVAASRVIILDPFWNPFVEMQAVDRAYRIGQQQSVEVHRILIQGTVEDRIIELQEKKRKLVDAALDEGANKSLGRLDVRQLAFLFGVGDGK